mgnify:CR=1 FL=1
MIRQGLPCRTFILHGEEEYVKLQAVNSVENCVPSDFRPFNLSVLNKPTPQQLYEACETLPFMADKRYVICNELAEGVEAARYAECLDKRSEETVLLMVFRGKLAGNLYMAKYAAKHEAEVLFDPLTPGEKAGWVIKHAAEAGVAVDPSTAQLAVRVIGGDMAQLVGETDKLIDYVGRGGAVTPQAVSACVRPSLDVRIFDMLDMFTYGKPADGIKALHALIDEGNEPMSIASFLCGRFKLMLEARRGIDAGKSKREVAAAMEGNRYANEKAYDAARRFTSDELLKLIAKLSDTSYLKITGAVKDDKYLEMVLLEHDWKQQPVR